VTTRALAVGLGLAALAAAEGRAQPRRQSAAPVGTVEHVWKPVRDGGAEVVAIEVRTVLREFPASAGDSFSVSAPITYAGVPGIADRVRDLQVTDSAGVVTFRVQDDPANPGGFPFYRRWHAARRVSFPLTITYRSLAPAQPPGGPPFGLFAAHGGVSGAGSGFLVLPETRGAVTSRVRWDLSDLASGSTGATTFGVGDFEVRGPASQPRQGWIMAGPLGRHPANDPGAPFQAFWLGEPTWDPAQEMKWAAEMYAYLGREYAYLSPLPPYRVFVRTGRTGGGRGGGATALANSFIIGAAARQPGAAPQGTASRSTLTHEMGHMFVGGIAAPQGVSSWFSEGLNVYYTRLLPLRGGFTTVEEYGRAINDDFQNYHGNAARNLSADSIVRIGFTDGNVRHIPYVRGSLYFADLDSKIRAHSKGRRDLDVVVRELFERRERGEPFDHDVWIATVEREAGPGARGDFEGVILRGDRTLVPASDAFGPCFERRPVAERVVDGRARPASYEWVRVAGVPDGRCAKW
jgi:hypothetical protein